MERDTERNLGALRDVLARRDLTASSKLAFVLIACNEDRHLGGAQAARALGIGLRTWSSALAQLRKAGLIESVRDAFGRPCRHTIRLKEDDDA